MTIEELLIHEHNNTYGNQVGPVASMASPLGPDGTSYSHINNNQSAANSVNNTYTESHTGESYMPVYFQAIIIMMYSTITIASVGGNVTVLLAVFVNSHLRSTTNYFIVNLAIADLLLGTTVLPFSG